MHRTLLRFFSLFLCAVLLFAALPLGAAAEEIRDYSKFETVYDLYKEYYYLDKEGESILLDSFRTLLTSHPELFDEVMDSLMKSGDRFSRYLPPAAVQAQETAKLFGGVGMSVQQLEDGRIVVVELTPGSAAGSAGIKIGDQIVAIDDRSVLNLTVSAVVEIGRGEIGDEVTYTMFRSETGELLSFTMVREAVSTVTVSYEIETDKSSGVAYALCRINDFTGLQTYFEFVQFLHELEDFQVDRIVFDVRDNPGGDLDIVLDILNYLIPGEGKPLAKAIPRDESQAVEYLTTGRGIETGRIVVLVNQNTASAAELFSIALQDYGIAKIVGTQTYGKAVGQQYFDLEDGSEAVISAIQVASPLGKRYHEIGVIPDFEVKNTQTPRELPQFSVFSHGNYQQAVVGADNEVVYALEQRLVLLKLLISADTFFDKDTAQALLLYQNRMGLEPTGTLDLLTFQSITDLINVVKTVQIEHDNQMDKAVELITAP